MDFFTPFASRTIRFYAYHNSSKLPEVHVALQKYVENQGEMFQALTKKYGSEPPSHISIGISEISYILKDLYERGGGVSEGTKIRLETLSSEFVHQVNAVLYPDEKESYRERLVEFYTQYNPTKLKDVEETLNHYKGREEEMFELLKKRYIPEPKPLAPPPGMSQERESTPAVDARSRNLTTPAMQKRYQKFNQPTFLSKIWSADFDPVRNMNRAVQDTVGPVGSTNIRDRIVQFYGKYNPAKLNGLDSVLEAYKYEEAELLYDLIEKYGAEGTCEPYNPYRERLYKYLAHFDVAALADAEVLLQHFSGCEEELFRLLHERFGDLPVPDPGVVPAPQCVSRTGSILIQQASEKSPHRMPRVNRTPSMPGVYYEGEIYGGSQCSTPRTPSLRSIAEGTHPMMHPQFYSPSTRSQSIREAMPSPMKS